MTRSYDMPQCWAFSRQGVRCEGEAGHEGAHLVTLTWPDEECWEPTLVEMAGPSKTLPVLGYPDLPDDDLDLGEDMGDATAFIPVEGGPCYSCGCVEEIHPCEAHGCKTFVP